MFLFQAFGLCVLYPFNIYGSPLATSGGLYIPYTPYIHCCAEDLQGIMLQFIFFRRMHVHFTTPIFRVMLEHLVGTNGFNNGFLGSVGLLCPMLSKAGETNAMKCLRRLVQPRADGSFLVPEEIIQKFKDIAGGGRSEVLRLYEQCGCNKDPRSN